MLELRLSETGDAKLKLAKIEEMFNKAVTLKLNGNYSDAEKLLVDILTMLDHDVPSELLCNTYYYLGLTRFYIRRSTSLKKALECFEKSLEIANSINYNRGIGNSHTGIALVQRTQQSFEKSLSNHEKSIIILKEAKNAQFDLAMALNHLGYTFFTIGNFTMAFENYENSRSILENLNEPLQIARVEHNIGLALSLLKGAHSEAIKILSKTLKIFEEANHETHIKYNKMGLSFAYIELGNLANAEKLLKTLRKNEDMDIFSKIWYQFLWGYLYKMKGDFANAIDHLLLSLKDSMQVKQLDVSLYSLTFLAEVYTRLITLEDAYLRKALSTITKALDVAKSQGIHFIVGELKVIQGMLYLADTDIEKAHETLAKALIIAQDYKLHRLEERAQKVLKTLLNFEQKISKSLDMTSFDQEPIDLNFDEALTYISSVKSLLGHN